MAEIAKIERLIEDQPDEAGREILRNHRLEAQTVLANLEGAARAILTMPDRTAKLDAARKERQCREVEWVQSGGADREWTAKAEQREEVAPKPKAPSMPAPKVDPPKTQESPKPEPTTAKPETPPKPSGGMSGP
jgi:outer membrane biosynthesis protein TonB